VYTNLKRNVGSLLLVTILLFISASTISVADPNESTENNQAVNATKENVSQTTLSNTENLSPIQLGNYEKVAENNLLALYVNVPTLGLKVLNKKTGYIWNGTLDEEDKDLNPTWQNFFQSGLTIEYMDDKNKIRQASITGEKADIQLNNEKDGFVAHINYNKLGFQLSVQVHLQEDSLEFTIPYDSIKETNANRLEAIYLYPYFGATKGIQTDEGYMFVPDGSGALISLNKKTVATQPYIGRVFGEDFGIHGAPPITDTFALPPEQILIPVYGKTNAAGKNAFVTMIKSGAPYSEIRAYPSGVTTSYNWITTKWIYRETYFQPVDKKGNGITVNQKEKNRFDAVAKVMFLSNEMANYVGMAKRVQTELVQDGILSKKETIATEPLPVRLEIIAAENKKELIGKKVLTLTTVQELDEMLRDLLGNKIEKMMVVVRGWTKGGITGASPSHFPFEKRVGQAEEWSKFVKKYEDQGIPVYFYADYVKAYKSAEGYGEEDIAQAISEQLLLFYDQYWFLNPEASKKRLKEELEEFKKVGISHLALDSVGQNLFSSYSYPVSTREKSMKTYQSLFSSIPDHRFAFYKPNQYLWKYTDQFLDIPMGSSKFLLETEEVPFLQIVLKGYIDYYAPSSNFNANPKEAMLRMIDYGSYPSFYLTYRDSVELLYTDSGWLFTSQYSVWKDQIIQEYQMMNEALKPVRNATFENREEVHPGVIKNTYSNGYFIYINYTTGDVTLDNKTIAAQSFLVVGGE
jgi:hypothetical protein